MNAGTYICRISRYFKQKLPFLVSARHITKVLVKIAGFAQKGPDCIESELGGRVDELVFLQIFGFGFVGRFVEDVGSALAAFEFTDKADEVDDIVVFGFP